ncbi:MAG TPA: hypothetical protein VMU16_05230 [Candidatus Binataceae bacterium]|nr:hypothetical protein [Candidatus Binataceae bacterium]
MRRLILTVVLIAGAILPGGAYCAPDAANLARNGDLTNGSGNTPADWYAISTLKQLTTFQWHRTADGNCVVEMANPVPGYASWHQALYLAPGIYRINAKARIEFGASDPGNVSLGVQTYDGQQLISDHPRDSGNWNDIGMTLKIDRWGETTELLLQLGTPTTTAAGVASFRDITVTEIHDAASLPGPTYDVGEILARSAVETGREVTGARALGLICGLGLIALLGWGLLAVWRPAIEANPYRWTIAAIVMAAITAIEFAALFHFPGYYWDIWSKTNRAMLAAALGPSRIYDPGLPVDSYPPGSLYLLWMSGWLGRLIKPGADGFRVIVESPPVLATFPIGLAIFSAAWRGGRRARAIAAMLCFAFNPALLFDAVVWGQSDSIVALPMITAAILVIAGRYRLGWSIVALAMLAKPQAIALLPPLGLWTLLNAGLAECGWCAAAFIGVIAIGIAPFQLGHPWNWIIAVYRDLGTRYSDASVGAFNFLGLIGGIGAPDDARVIGVSYYSIGLAMTFAAYVIASYLIARARSAPSAILAMFVALFGFFMFAPRMHERYLYFSVVFMAPIALESGAATAIFAAVTMTFLMNLLYLKHLADISAYFSGHANPVLVVTATANLAAFIAAAAYGLAGNFTARSSKA